MKVLIAAVLLLMGLVSRIYGAESSPLRVFIRSGPKTHGPGQHDHPRFLQEWKMLLQERGLRAEGADHFPTATELGQTDVLILHAPDAASITGLDRTNFESFLARGGGLIVLHDAIVGKDPQWFKTIAGGAWENGKAKWFEGEVGEYFVDDTHPITRGISNFDWNDEIYYELDMMPDAHVLATSFQNIFVIAPQMWTYEKTIPGGQRPYRAFVSIPGHQYVSFNTPHYRALLLRGIAWSGSRTNVDEFCRPDELASLLYPEGGPTPPQKAASKLNAHPDFDVSLVASEPLIEKVISLDWDPQGRLWVAETPEYPNGRTLHRNDLVVHPERRDHPDRFSGEKEDRPARDRISWLEDTNGDGVMDRKHIFYEGLELVTSLVFYRDGVIVAQAPDILWLRDTDHDGKADRVERLYTGFGISDAHAVINNFRWGFDGWIYSTIGYSAGNPRSGDGSKAFGRVTAGVIRFRPDGSAVEQVASGSCNTWGLDFGPDGELFYTTATCGEHFLHVVLPEKLLARGNIGNIRASAVLPDHQQVFPALKYARQAYMQIDWVGMFTAAAGCCIYDGGAWPAQFEGSSFLSDPTINIVHRDVLRSAGTTFVASKEAGRELTEFITSSDLWFRPIHTRCGPDGALYVVDFYNQAVVHNDPRGPPHGARNAATRPDRNHKFGRIWRVQHKQAQSLPAWTLDPAQPATLVRMLAHPNAWVRQTAQRLLQEQSTTAATTIEALSKMARDAAAGPYARIHCLWTLANLNALDRSTELAVLNDHEPVVLKNALLVTAQQKAISERESGAAGTAGSEDTSLGKIVLTRCAHADARVKLAALTALQERPLDEQTCKALVEAFPNLADPWLESAVVGLGTNPKTGALEQDRVTMFLEAAFHSVNGRSLSRFVTLFVRQIALKQDGPAAAELVVWLARQEPDTAPLKVAALQELTFELKPAVQPGFPSPSPRHQLLVDAMTKLLADPAREVAAAILPLVGRWDTAGSLTDRAKPMISQLAANLRESSLPDDARSQIASELLAVRHLDPAVLPAVSDLLASPASPILQQHIAQALGRTGDPAARDLLLKLFNEAAAPVRDIIFGEIVQRPAWARAFVERVANRQIPLTALSPAFTYRLRTHSDPDVARLTIETLERLRGPETKQKDALIAKLQPEVEKPGEVSNGHHVFTTNCAVCHMFKEEGLNLAPNLTGMGAHSPAELLIHILDPNRIVEPNFLSQTIETRDELAYSGIIERENDRELVLRNATGDYTLQQKDIKSRNATGLSLMPEGFEQLGASNLRDLLAFLAADDHRFRVIDLRTIFTADTARGIYTTRESTRESLAFRQFGMVKVSGIPFEIVSPAKSLNGNNVIVLRGRNGLTRDYPRRVEVPNLNLNASRLHFLGGIGAWAWPYGGDSTKGLPVATVTVTFADKSTEVWTLVNGVDLVDYIGTSDVPGSKPAEGLVQSGQVRFFSKAVTRRQPITRITLESMNNQVAPTFIAITAELDPDLKTASQSK